MSILSVSRIAWSLLSTFAFGGAAFAQTTWYVDASATPPGLGTPASPYASIQYAVDRPTTVDGDTVLVAPGTYAESLTVYKAISVRASQGPLVTTLASTVGLDGVELFHPVTRPVLEGFTIVAHTAASGVYLPRGTLRRCVVRDCTSIAGIESPDGVIESCVVVANRQGVVASGHGWGQVALRNSIVFGNPQGDLTGFVAGTATIDYCAGLSFPGTGNIPGDPGLWNLEERDVRLRVGSPCIDAGDPAGPLDPDGTRMDIGALVFDPSYAPPPIAYCSGKLNSQGCVPAIGATGSASMSSTAPFVISGGNFVPGKLCWLLLGRDRAALPFQGGTLCLTSPIKRLGLQNSVGGGPCTGATSFDMRAYIQSGVNPVLDVGALVTVQWWGRDLQDPAGFATTLSNALQFGVAP